MLTVHHLGLSQSERVVWLCEELALEYELKRYERRSDNRLAPDEYKALHPMGIAPVITDGDLILAESGAIVDYIAAKYGAGRLVPSPEHPDFAQHLFWLHFSNATFMAIGMMEISTKLAGADELPALVEDRRNRAWNLVEQQLGETEYLGGGQLTTADIMMGFPLTTMRMLNGFSIDNRPNLKAYLQRIGSREAYRRAFAKAEPGLEPKLD